MVDKFFFPVNFLISDMEEDQEIRLILDRPFLATTMIMYKEGT